MARFMIFVVATALSLGFFWVLGFDFNERGVETGFGLFASFGIGLMSATCPFLDI